MFVVCELGLPRRQRRLFHTLFVSWIPRVVEAVEPQDGRAHVPWRHRATFEAGTELSVTEDDYELPGC